MKQVWRSVHPDFKLDGFHHPFEALQKVGKGLLNGGEQHQVAIGEFLRDWSNNNETLEVHTSGSTGNPKKIPLQKSQMVNSAIATGAYFGLHPKNTALLCLPCTGIAGKMMLVRAMVLGLELSTVAPSKNPLSDTDGNFDFVAMVPLQVQNSLAQLSRIKTLLIGGAPISTNLKKALSGLSNAIFETYGMTETITHIAAKRLSTIAADQFEVLPEVSIAADDRGCLVINAPKVADGKVVTNDLVALTSKTTFRWLGRYDSIINSGGIKLIPEQIENKLSAIIPDRFFVAGIPDETLGNQLVLVVESNKINTEKLLAKIKTSNNLDKYEIPKKIYQLETFVETQSGKIHRAKTLESLLG